jgi:hypothetical protein
VIDVDDVLPLPDTVDEHEVYGASKPPAGTDSENCTDDPDTVPDTVPRPEAPVLLSVIVNDPENDEPDCVICHVIVPGPEESVAVPVQVPFTLAGADGSVGLEPPPPPHAADSASEVSKQAPRRQGRRTYRVFMGRMRGVYCGWASRRNQIVERNR